MTYTYRYVKNVIKNINEYEVFEDENFFISYNTTSEVIQLLVDALNIGYNRGYIHGSRFVIDMVKEAM